MDKLTNQDVLAFLELLTDELPQHQDELRELDAQVGDGDLGITIVLGMKGIKEALPALADSDIGTILARSGMNFNRAAASTFGVLFASALMRAGKQVQNKTEIELNELAEIFAASAEGIRQRGNAQLGDKTMLDVIVPMAETLQQAAVSGWGMAQAVQSAQARCREALEEITPLVGKHGRSGWMGEKGAGVPDPGATAICLMMECFGRFIESH